MTLYEFLCQVENDDVELQINTSDDWDVIDVVSNNSPLLRPFIENSIYSLTAIDKDVFRFTLRVDK